MVSTMSQASDEHGVSPVHDSHSRSARKIWPLLARRCPGRSREPSVFLLFGSGRRVHPQMNGTTSPADSMRYLCLVIQEPVHPLLSEWGEGTHAPHLSREPTCSRRTQSILSAQRSLWAACPGTSGKHCNVNLTHS